MDHCNLLSRHQGLLRDGIEYSLESQLTLILDVSPGTNTCHTVHFSGALQITTQESLEIVTTHYNQSIWGPVPKVTRARYTEVTDPSRVRVIQAHFER